MAINGFTTGQSIQLNIKTQQGELTLNTMTSIDLSMNPEMQKIQPINGPPTHLVFPSGGRGAISLERKDSTLQDFWAAYEKAYYAGQNIVGGSIIETITESDGTTTQYLYTDVMISVEDMGRWTGTSAVAERVNFYFGTMDKLA